MADEYMTDYDKKMAEDQAERDRHYAEFKAEQKRKEELAERVKSQPFTEDTMCVIVTRKPDGWHEETMTVAQLRKDKRHSGHLGADLSAQRARGMLCKAHIFDNAPLLDKYIGPMWGGLETPLRYENQQAYDELSI